MAFRAKSNRTRSQITIRWRRVARFDEIRTPGLAREGRALYLPAPIWSQLRPLSKKWDQGRAGISNIVPPFRAAGPDCSSGLDARSLWTVAESGSGLRSNWQGRACWHHGLGGYVIIQAPMFSVRTDPGTDPVDVRRPPTPCLLLFFFFTSWLGIKVKTPSYYLLLSFFFPLYYVCPFLCFPFNVVSTNYSTIQTCPSLMCSFNRVNIEGTNSSKVCVWRQCMYVLLYVCDGTGFVDWFHKGFIYMRTVLKFAFAYVLSFPVLRWPSVVTWTLKSKY